MKRDALVQEMRAMMLNSTPDPMCYNRPSFDGFPSYCSNLYSSAPPSRPAPKSRPAPSTSGTRKNFTQTELARVQSLSKRHGNDYDRITRDFNSSRRTTTVRATNSTLVMKT